MMTDFRWYNGKYEGVLLSEMIHPDHIHYLKWKLINHRMKPLKEDLVKHHIAKVEASWKNN